MIEESAHIGITKTGDDEMTTENRFETMIEAETRATELTAETGKQHVAYKTNYVFKKFQVSMLPQIGDETSMAFNGDAYPTGKIVRISPTYSTITTEKGNRFTRVSEMCWKEGGKNGGFSMILGIHEKRNPSF